MNDETIANQQASPYELGWLAGIIDGEGYIGLRGANNRGYTFFRPEMMIINTDEEIIKKTQMIFQKLDVNPYIRTGHNGKKNAKMYYKLQIKNLTKTLKILKPVINLLTGNKKERAGYIIEFCESRIGRCKVGISKRQKPYLARELELVDKCQTLQTRGRASETLREARIRSEKILVEIKKRDDKVRTNGRPLEANSKS